MTTTDDQIRLAIELKEAILDRYRPEIVILFGSLGRGDSDEFSDVDLFVVIDTDHADDLANEMSLFLDYITEEKHIIVRSPVEYFKQCDIPGTIAFAASKEGRILFERETYSGLVSQIEPYEIRKNNVIHKEYIGQAYDFLDQAGSELNKGNLFRFRDSARFSAVRAIKAVFVKHDIHPPRETDLKYLMLSAMVLEPDLGDNLTFIEELNTYRPGGNIPVGNQKSMDILKKTIDFVGQSAGIIDNNKNL